MKNCFVQMLLCLLTCWPLLAQTPSLAAERPLLQQGKKSVFQRVVSNPGAQLYAEARPDAQILTVPKVFTSYYVYERTNDMIRVGVSAAKADGWLRATDTTEWNQAITMVFTGRMGRKPVLFFRDHQSLIKTCQADSIHNELSQWYTLFAQKARIPDTCPVIAMEPGDDEGSVAEQNFYLMPVLNLDTQFKESGAQLLEVACVDPGSWNGATGSNSGATGDSSTGKGDANGTPAKKPNAKNQKTGIAFVIDTTISMKPYIDQTVELAKRIYDQLENSPARDNYGMAVVAFRSNLERSPGIEYTTKVVSDFKKVKDRKELETLLGQVDEAKASTHAFDEDALAGVETAIKELSWDEYSGKLIMLITDAGPLGAGDPTSRTGLSPADMADTLQKENIYLVALHVKAPSGKKDHKYAEESYVSLAKMQNNRDGYLPLDASTLKKGTEEFDEVAGRVATGIQAFVAQNLQNAQSMTVATPQASPHKGKETTSDKAARVANAIGYAMHLQFVGNELATSAPKVVKAWMSDADLTLLEKNPDDAPVPTVYPAVLLTKAQLSQLRKQLQLIIDTAEKSFLEDNESFNFFEQLISASAQMSRDPTQFNQNPKANLSQQGVLLEVLDGLPYKSHVLALTQEDWTNRSTGEKNDFIKRLKGLIRLYDEYDRDGRHWEGFGLKNTERSEWVYRVPLRSLP